MAEQKTTTWTGTDAGLAVVLGWLVPGAGHLYLGERRKALLIAVFILGAFFAGQALADFQCVFYRTTPMLKSRLWFYGQAGAGLPALYYALITPARTEGQEQRLRYEPYASKSIPAVLQSGFEMGTLWTTMAGLLNLLAVVDVYDVYYRRKHPERRRPAAQPPPEKDAPR
jgi:hypothetical protein